MRVVILTSSFPLGPSDGSPAGLFARSFSIALARLGNEVIVVTQERPGVPEKEDEIEVVRFPWSGKGKPLVELRLRRPGDLLKAISFLRNALRTVRRIEKVDHCFALWAAPSGLVASLWSRLSGVPYSVWCLGSDVWVYGRSRFTRPWIRTVLSRATRVFADGEGLRREAESIGRKPAWFLSTSRTLPPPGPRPERFSKVRKNFVFIGRYHSAKGPDILIRAVKLLDPGIRSRIQVHFFGEGPMRSEMEKEIRESAADGAPLDEAIRIGGAIGAAEISTVLFHSDFCVIPSRFDSIPVVFSESLQSGTPLIVSDSGDSPELVRKFGLGYVFPSGDSAELAERIGRAANDRREEYSDGIRRLLPEFDVPRSAERFRSVIEDPRIARSPWSG